MGAVTMSIHKLTAGSGYDYLTRQVAAFDSTAKGHVGLASYYTERGESPGVWVGSGLVGIDGLEAGDAVTAEQMRALFGAGMHPLAAQRLEQLGDADLTDTNVKAATRLGAPFKSPTPNLPDFGLRWRGGSPRSTSTPGCQETGQSRRPSEQGLGLRGRGSCSPLSMVGHQRMPGRWRPTIAKHSRPGRRRSPASI
jgi:hypothetical protein